MKAAEKFVFICCLFQGVLCREFSISLPESIEALRGLCVLIPCSFDFKEQYDEELQNNPRGVWYKGDSWAKHKVFSSKTTEGNKIDGKIIGDLYRKNCTTIFYNINSPISPSITLYREDQGEVEDQKEVVEGTSVSLICSARSPCPFNPPIFTWNFPPEERRQEQNHNARFRSSQLNFKATRLHHGVNFTCTATYQLQNITKSAQSSLTLHVLYAPRNTSVSASPSASVLLGSSVSLSCSSDANPAVLNYTWYRENGGQIGTGKHLTISKTASTHRGLYYCRAQNQLGDQKSSVYLDVLCTAPEAAKLRRAWTPGKSNNPTGAREGNDDHDKARGGSDNHSDARGGEMTTPEARRGSDDHGEAKRQSDLLSRVGRRNGILSRADRQSDVLSQAGRRSNVVSRAGRHSDIVSQAGRRSDILRGNVPRGAGWGGVDVISGVGKRSDFPRQSLLNKQQKAGK
ncbi:hypothetical protein PGIGA_G00088480 [Pangasianodon gigas]|uniref:Uncharacterized protein n=1 Tax=Pangasianodon gigas TaxID=30993 RepID=A0ACC5XC18_PANGG|nr:hypothetical protein [Pangasianodon gigas]